MDLACNELPTIAKPWFTIDSQNSANRYAQWMLFIWNSPKLSVLKYRPKDSLIQSKHSSQRNHRFRTIHIRFHFATIVLLAVSLSSSPRKQPGASPTSHHQHCSPQPLQMDFQGTNRLPPSLFCIKNLPPNDGKVVIDGGSKAAPRRCSLCERCCTRGSTKVQGWLMPITAHTHRPCRIAPGLVSMPPPLSSKKEMRMGLGMGSGGFLP